MNRLGLSHILNRSIVVSRMTAFGSLLRHFRLRAGLGLRTFAGLLDQRASVVSAIESGRRAPWRQDSILIQVAEILGLCQDSKAWHEFLGAADRGDFAPAEPRGKLLWWWTSSHTAQPDAKSIRDLASFLGGESDLEEYCREGALPHDSLTELEIEWRVRSLLGPRNTPIVSAPIDVESVLENGAQVRLEIVPGLVPRFSVQACVLRHEDQLTIVIDRIVGDSRPTSSYRHVLAQCYAPIALRECFQGLATTGAFFDLLADGSWPLFRRDCSRFALSLMLPATPLLQAAESAYRELISQQGWVELEEATRTIRNRLAEQFAVPTTLVHHRLMGWPCHLYGRIAQALAAQEPTLPPTDWMEVTSSSRQRLLFENESM